jgi:hypothetical protein
VLEQVRNITKMFEFEEAGGLHDVFLNKHAVSDQKKYFVNFERQMFDRMKSKMEVRAPIHSQPAKKKIFVMILDCRAERRDFQRRSLVCLRNLSSVSD